MLDAHKALNPLLLKLTESMKKKLFNEAKKNWTTRILRLRSDDLDQIQAIYNEFHQFLSILREFQLIPGCFDAVDRKMWENVLILVISGISPIIIGVFAANIHAFPPSGFPPLLTFHPEWQ